VNGRTRTTRELLTAYETWWTARVDGASISLFRILLGAFILFDAGYFVARADSLFSDRTFYIHYPGFAWWPELGTTGNLAVIGALALSGLALVFGAWSRIALACAFLCTAHILLLDYTYYMNHIALMLVLTGVCAFVPMDRYWALRPAGGARRDRTVARYELYSVIGVLWASYFFGGLSKLRADWLSGNVFLSNMVSRQESSYIARWFTQDPLPLLGAWTGLFLDLGAPFALAFPLTRLPMLAALVSFHVLNHQMLNIGLFSYLMFFGMVLYFDPAWPKVWLEKALRPGAKVAMAPVRSKNTRGLKIMMAATLGLLIFSGAMTLSPGKLVPWLSASRIFGWQFGLGRPSCHLQLVKGTSRGEAFKLSDLVDRRHRKIMFSSPALAWNFVRGSLCGDWGAVYGRLRCTSYAPGSFRPEVHVRMNPELDLCTADYHEWRDNPWIAQ
jgi:hypothetical protein